MKCMVCSQGVQKFLWCDPCWEVAKARVLTKYKAESERKPKPAVELSIKDALGLEFKPGAMDSEAWIKRFTEAKDKEKS